MFVKCSDEITIIVLIYVDDIIIIIVVENNKNKFDIEGLEKLKYFLEIKITHLREKSLFLSQRKYILDLLKVTCKLDPKSASTPMKPKKKLYFEEGEPLKDVGQYQKFIGKLIYNTVTRLDITFVVSLVSQFMYAPRTTHLEVIVRILRYLKKSPGQDIWMGKNNTNSIVGYSDAY
jgi:hypothetical protein